MSTPINFKQLAAPFALEDIEFRAGATNQEKTRALALAYITSRAVMTRLDDVVGPQNWRDEYRPGPDGGVICGLTLRVAGEWITKWDGAENTNYEAIKGGLSDAFKRAAVKWGIGRYLYNSPDIWLPCQVRGKTVIINQDEAREKFRQLAAGQAQSPPPVSMSQGIPAEQPQPRLNGNGRKTAPDPMTAFWVEAHNKGFNREQGQKVLAGAGGDPGKALAALERAVNRLN